MILYVKHTDQDPKCFKTLFALVNNESFYNFFITRFSELIFILFPRNKLSHNSDTEYWLETHFQCHSPYLLRDQAVLPSQHNESL